MQSGDLTLFSIEELNKRLHECIQSIENSQGNVDGDNINLLLEELRVHQIELEMANRELIESKSELETTRAKYANLYDFSPIGFASFDQKGCIQEINLTACKMLGYERLVMLDKPFSICMSLSDTQAFFNHLKEVTSVLKKCRTRLMLKSSSGEEFQVELESICQTSINGQIVIQSAIIDITDRLAAEHSEIEKDNELHAIINSLPVLVSHIDRNFQYVFSNVAHDKVFPLKDNSYIGKDLRSVIGSELFSLLLPYIQTVLEGHEVAFEIKTLVTKRDTVFRINLLPKYSHNGVIDSFFMLMTDITLFKQKEMAVLAHLSSAAHEARINLIGQMTAEIAHEINQPLAAIANYSVAGLHMQDSGKLDSNQITEIFHEIDNQVHRAGEIINYLKKFSKKRELQRDKKNINSLVKDVLKLVVADEQLYGIKIDAQLDDSIPPLFIDGVLIEQVLINLLRNAVDALREFNQKKPLITLKTQQEENDIIISIADNGPGLAYDMLEEVFRPFYSTKETGVGLGLSICKSIIETHQGKLWAMRNNQSGTTFYIQLPINFTMD